MITSGLQNSLATEHKHRSLKGSFSHAQLFTFQTNTY
uniref:Uncharacterized protein n=1 Tax=Arundo donax TaxID=35708 RepID=A0A0A9D2Z4_ARUDO